MFMQSPSSSSSSSSTSSSSDGCTYDVFISFRGTDTRHGFTSHLYKTLSDEGIHTFMDDEKLPRGDKITLSLRKSIEDSRIAIIVFSKNYASSTFCLDELAHIIHHFKVKGRLVLPVFYDVEPTDVRHQSGSYAEHLTKHEEKSMDRTEYEHMFIEKIVKDVSNKIKLVPLHVADYPVGLEPRISEVRLLLDFGSSDGVCIIGIHGAGGMGKTSLARAVYNSIYKQFEGSCFLHDVRENSVRHGLANLQEQLLFKLVKAEEKFGHVNEGIPIIRERLCKKKVLLILDDVDKLEQLRSLIGEPDWLGPGSKVIITTRDKHLLSSHQINKIYEANGLNEKQALELLRTVAFKSKKNDSSYDSILNRAVKYASGLPLALEVVGSNLSGRSVEECESLLDKYERIPHKNILKTLKVSFDALEDDQKSIFLDIACFFKGCDPAYIKEELQYDHDIKIDLTVLVEKSLIKIDREYYWQNPSVRLHDLIEDMGKEIVRQESPNNPGGRSRLWFHDDIVKVLEEDMGTEHIKVIYLICHSKKNVIEWNGNAFKKMTNLEILVIENVDFSKGPEYLPSGLRVLKLNRCPLISPSFIWNKKFNYMKVLTLDNCELLSHIPYISGLLNLEKFSFRKCHSLITIDNSVGQLDKLKILDVSGCKKIESFPPLRLPSLKKLTLDNCTSLKRFPEILCKMTNIKGIMLGNTPIVEFPNSFQNLSEVRCLDMFYLSDVRCLDMQDNDKMNSSKNVVLSKVQYLNLAHGRISDECLQMFLNWCLNVTRVDLTSSNLKILPECLHECHLMRILKLDYCKLLEEIRGFPPNLEEFSANWCESLNSSSRRMLLSEELHEKLHEAGYKEFRFGSSTKAGDSRLHGTQGIPDWFEHQSRGHKTISFRFRTKIPSINVIILREREDSFFHEVKFYVNDCPRDLPEGQFYDGFIDILPLNHAVLFDLKLEEVLLENEWITVMLKLDRNVQMGIHVWKEKNNMEEDVIFTNPYCGDTEEEDDSSDDESKRFKVSETETVDFAQMGIHEERNTEEDVIFTNPYSDTKSDEDKNLEVSETKTVERQNLEESISETETVQRQSLEETVSETEHGRCDVHCMTLLFERIASLFARRETVEKCARRNEEEKKTEHQS